MITFLEKIQQKGASLKKTYDTKKYLCNKKNLSIYLSFPLTLFNYMCEFFYDNLCYLIMYMPT